MNKADMLQPSVEQSLIDIDFINRYRAISDKFSFKDESYKYGESDVVNILKELGVTVNMYEGDQYFTDFESIDDYLFRFGLTIKFNIVEFDLTVKNESQNITSGGSWGLLVQLMTDWKENIKKPSFGSYEQLKSLLMEAVTFYEDIKKSLLASQS